MSRMPALRTPADIEKKLRSAARELIQEKSDLARLGLEQFLNTETRSDEQTLHERAKNVIGSIETGILDLGSSHRRHLRAGLSLTRRSMEKRPGA